MKAEMMMSAIMVVGLALTAQSCLGAQGPAARPFLHSLFTDNMVFPRDVEAPVWGWAAPGQVVTVGMAGKTATATAGESGKWMAKLGPFAAGGPHEMQVSGPQDVTLRNVLVGDVWICSGQSNMQWPVSASNNAEQEMAAADLPTVRLFTVPNIPAFEPQETVDGAWVPCTPATVPWFTAVGYFFGRHLNKELGVPIGLINSSWGGTICEAWASAEALKTMPDFVGAVNDLQHAVDEQRKSAATYDQQVQDWYARNDEGSAEGTPWAASTFDDSPWKTMDLPVHWENAGLPDFDGVAWFRKTIDVPAAWAGKEALLRLGPIDDRDTTWVNGTLVGANDTWTTMREYALPAGLLKAGANCIAVRVLDTGGAGGICGKPEDMELRGPDGATISLAGRWQYKDSVALSAATPLPQRLDSNPNVVTVLYNGMIAPLTPFAVKGAIWYQGESNAGRAEQYARLLPTMIRDWQNAFEVAELPFFIVQLANFMAQDAEPRDDAWPHLREAQWVASLAADKGGLAVAIDIGDAEDIHPRNKQDVGLRLALSALAIAYDRDIVYSGPLYTGMAVEGSKARLSFDHVGGGLVARGERLTGFAIAGADRHFVWADATIDGDTVLVSSHKVAAPVAVRYAWGNNPICNLYNAAGLPAVPFRTDR